MEQEDFGERLDRLRAVPIRDDGEPLVDPRDLSPRLRFAETHPKFDGPRTCLLRRGVAERLARAAQLLPDGIDLKILEGFRPLAQQRAEYAQITDEMRAAHPDWDDAKLAHEVSLVSAPPDDPSPPPHSTGAAVDLCPFRTDTGEHLDLTSPYEWDEKSAPTEVGGLSLTAQENRRMLADALSAAGLTNYAGEWWHWSYGDQGWALRVGAPFALYDRLPDAG